MTGFQNVSAVCYMDYHTARNLLSEAKLIYGACYGSTILVTGKLEPRPVKPILYRSLSEAYREHKKYPVTPGIICMPPEWADSANIPILDKDGPAPEIDLQQIEKVVKAYKSKVKTPTIVPIVSIDSIIISECVKRIQQNQILSHFNTFMYSCPKSIRDYLQETLLAWLGGKLTLPEFKSKVAVKAKLDCDDLLAVMADRGKEYQSVFSALFNGKKVAHTFPAFEVAYFCKLNTRLGKKT